MLIELLSQRLLLPESTFRILPLVPHIITKHTMYLNEEAVLVSLSIRQNS